MIPPILYASLVLGRLAVGHPEAVARATELEVAPADVPAFVIGSVILAVSVSLAGGLVTWLGVSLGRLLWSNESDSEAEA